MLAYDPPKTVAGASGAAGVEWRGTIRLTILGQPVSLKNNYVLVQSKKHRRTFMLPNDKVKKYQALIRKQVPRREPLLTGKLKFSATLYYASERPDLDAEAIYDALAGWVYLNDRQLRDKHLYHAIDKANPRAEIVIEPWQAELP